jgi:DNA-binding PadR family transcriptional regulator
MNDLLLLATLLAGPAHGYALKKRVGHITGQSDMHNNLVYPLLKRFVDSGWVSRKTVPGERGQTRERYALMSKGKQELLRRLEEFTEKDAARSEGFQLRVGLFSVLSPDARIRILDLRQAWVAARATRLANLAEKMELGEWGGESVAFLRAQIAAEQKWLKELRKKAERNAPKD